MTETFSLLRHGLNAVLNGHASDVLVGALLKIQVFNGIALHQYRCIIVTNKGYIAQTLIKA